MEYWIVLLFEYFSFSVYCSISLILFLRLAAYTLYTFILFIGIQTSTPLELNSRMQNAKDTCGFRLTFCFYFLFFYFYFNFFFAWFCRFCSWLTSETSRRHSLARIVFALCSQRSTQVSGNLNAKSSTRRTLTASMGE